MSENKKPENLLAVVRYSGGVVTVSEYGYGPYRLPITGMRTYCKTEGKLIKLVTGTLRAQVADGFCGFIVASPNPKTSKDDTIIRVYKLPDRFKCHRLKVDSDLLTSSRWLQRFLHSLNPLSVYSDAAARGEIGLTSTATGTVSDKLHLFADRNDQRERVEATEEKLSPAEWVKKNLPNCSRMLVGSTPIASEARHPTDHIPALRGLFAMARGNYATVSAADLTAAVDAGYAHPDVLAAVADELAYIAATDELLAGLQDAAQEPTPRSVSDLSFDYQNACLDFVFEDRARWVKLHTWDNAGGSAHVDSYELKHVLLEVAPDLTCRELGDIGRAISDWLDETVWDDCATTWGAYIGEIIAARARLRSVRTA